MVMRLFDGITKLEQKPGVCKNVAALVLPPLPAGLMETPAIAQSTDDAAVQVSVTLAAPGWVLAPEPTRLLKNIFHNCVWLAPGLPAAPKLAERSIAVSNTSSPGAE